MKTLTFSLLFLLLQTLTQAQNRVLLEVEYKESIKNNQELFLVNLSNQESIKINQETEKFNISYREGDRLVLIKGDKTESIQLRQLPNSLNYESLDSKFSAKISEMAKLQSSWVGVSIGYDLNNADQANIIGSAHPVLALVKKDAISFNHWQAAVTGNISDFKEVNSAERIEENIQKVLSSNEGLDIGMTFTFTKERKIMHRITMRSYFNPAYRINTFTNEIDSLSVPLHQFRSNVGIILEGWEVTNGNSDSPFHLSSELSFSAFDKNAYLSAFGKEESTLWGIQNNLILPLSSNVGVLFYNSFSKGSKPDFASGLVIKVAKKD